MKILIIDDDYLVSSSLKTIVESDVDMEVVGVGHHGLEAIELYSKLQPDVLLMDIRMEKMSGIDGAREIIRLYPDAKILFLTTFQDDEYIIDALKIGAKGYLLKQNFESIIPSIHAVYAGQRVFGDAIMTRLPSLMSETSKTDYKDYDLSEKEYLILTHVAEGLSNKEIADTICLGEGTVRNYISIILEKLQLRDRTQLAIFFYKANL